MANNNESSAVSEEKLITDEEFKGELISELNQLRKEGILCDITLRIEGQDFPVHRCVLSAASPYFRALFTIQFAESNSDLLELQEVKSAVANEALGFIYTGEARVNSTNALDLLSAADYWIIPRLKIKVATFLNDTVNASNCLALESFAAKFNCESLKQTAISCQIQNFFAVGKSEDFKELEYEKIKELISRDDIIVSKEEEVYEVVVSWVKHDLAAREHLFPELLKCVRIFSMSEESLREILDTEELVIKNRTNLSIVNEGMDYFLFPDRFQNMSLNPRDYECETVVVLTGGKMHSYWRHLETNNTTRGFVLSKNCWLLLPAMPFATSAHGAAVCCGQLYVVGGYSRQLCSFNRKQNKWICHAEKFPSRVECSVTTHDKELYVIGGVGQQYWNSVDIYNPSLDQWRKLAPMKTPRAAHCAVSLANLIYVIGGYGCGTCCTSSVECLNPLTDQWTDVADLITARRLAAATACNGKIFVFGGYGYRYTGPIETCEMYDPGVSRWSLVSSLRVPRAACGIVSFDNHVYLFGGEEDWNSPLDSVECYDVHSDTWKKIGAMPAKLTNLQASLLPLPKEFL